MSEVTILLTSMERGDATAAERLLPLLYDELRKLAASKMSAERPGHSLYATDLVHEAFVRLVDVERPQHWNSRGHFFAAAAEAMRRILVERARHKRRLKHGGDLQQATVEWCDIETPGRHEDLIALDEALNKLRQHDGTAAELVQLRYFTGVTMSDAAEMLNISVRSADRSWAYAKAWLRREMA